MFAEIFSDIATVEDDLTPTSAIKIFEDETFRKELTTDFAFLEPNISVLTKIYDTITNLIKKTRK